MQGKTAGGPALHACWPARSSFPCWCRAPAPAYHYSSSSAHLPLICPTLQSFQRGLPALAQRPATAAPGLGVFHPAQLPGAAGGRHGMGGCAGADGRLHSGGSGQGRGGGASAVTRLELPSGKTWLPCRPACMHACMPPHQGPSLKPAAGFVLKSSSPYHLALQGLYPLAVCQIPRLPRFSLACNAPSLSLLSARNPFSPTCLTLITPRPTPHAQAKPTTYLSREFFPASKLCRPPSSRRVWAELAHEPPAPALHACCDLCIQ